MRRIYGIAAVLVLCLPNVLRAQISFFNMPNPDMLPAVGYSYFEYDQYQTLRNNKSVNAYVPRLSYQATPFLEVGANVWFNKEHDNVPERVVIATKWRAWLYQSPKIKVSMSPGFWESIYFNHPMKHLVYDFFGLTINHTDVIYTRLMFGAYGKYWKVGPEQSIPYKKFTKGVMAGVEQRLTKGLVFVTDYFSGSGEGYGLAPGLVWYVTENGNNLPLYLAYQIDNDSKKNNLLLFEIGYFFNVFGPKH
jgi:hypothetical protein